VIFKVLGRKNMLKEDSQQKKKEKDLMRDKCGERDIERGVVWEILVGNCKIPGPMEEKYQTLLLCVKSNGQWWANVWTLELIIRRTSLSTHKVTRRSVAYTKMLATPSEWKISQLYIHIASVCHIESVEQSVTSINNSIVDITNQFSILCHVGKSVFE